MAQEDLTIIVYTDNSLDERIAKLCRDHLRVASELQPIISVSQKPIDLGRNICIGQTGRSHLSMYSQILAGLEAAETDVIALAEHDCLYSPEHFRWRPPELDVFYYNTNVWWVQWESGVYNFHRRRVLSQLICGREACLKAIRDKVYLLRNGYMIRHGVAGALEPGCVSDAEAFAHAAYCEAGWLKSHDIKDIKTEPPQLQAVTQEPGVCDEREVYLSVLKQFKDVGKEVGVWRAETFKTKIPNLDIRHNTNFSRGRSTPDREYELPYWGVFEDVKACA